MTGRRVTPAARLVLPASAPEAEWLAARRWRPDVPGHYCIGSSDVPSILDLQGVDTPAHVWHDKVNGLAKEPTEQMSWGHIFEEPIAFEWCRRNRTTVRKVGLVSNIAEPWHQTTLDRRVLVCPLGIDGGCFVEIKNMGAFTYSTRWHEDLPDRIMAQIIHQLIVTGYGHGHYVANVGGNRMIQGVVYADRERKLMDVVRTAVNNFRTAHLLTGVEPPWTAEEKVDKYLALEAQLRAERTGEIAITDLDPVLEYAEWSRKETEAKNAKKALKLRLALLAAGAQTVTVADQRAYWYGQGRRSDVDLERLSEKYPHAYADPEIVTHTDYPILHVDSAIKRMAKQ